MEYFPAYVDALAEESEKLGIEYWVFGCHYDLFWQVAADYPVKAIVGCDAHAPEELDLVPLLRQKQAYLQGLGIPVLDTLPGLV